MIATPARTHRVYRAVHEGEPVSLLVPATPNTPLPELGLEELGLSPSSAGGTLGEIWNYPLLVAVRPLEHELETGMALVAEVTVETGEAIELMQGDLIRPSETVGVSVLLSRKDGGRELLEVLDDLEELGAIGHVLEARAITFADLSPPRTVPVSEAVARYGDREVWLLQASDSATVVAEDGVTHDAFTQHRRVVVLSLPRDGTWSREELGDVVGDAMRRDHA